MCARFKKVPKSSHTLYSKSKIEKLKKWRQEFMRHYMKNSSEDISDETPAYSSSTSVAHEKIIRFIPTYNCQPSYIPTIPHDFQPNKTNILPKKHFKTPHCGAITENLNQGAAVKNVKNVVHQKFAKKVDVKYPNEVININESLDHTGKCPLCKEKNPLSNSNTKRLKELEKEMFTVRHQLDDLIKQLKDENKTKAVLEKLILTHTRNSVKTNKPPVDRSYNSEAKNPLCSLSKPHNVISKKRSPLKKESFGNIGTLVLPTESKKKAMMQQLKQSKKIFKNNESGKNSADILTAPSSNCMSSAKSVKPCHSKNNGVKFFGTSNTNACNSQENKNELIPVVALSNKSTTNTLNLEYCNVNFKTDSETTNSLGIKQTRENFLKYSTTSKNSNIKKILENSLEDSTSRKSLKFFIPHHIIKVKSEAQTNSRSNSDKSKKDRTELKRTANITSSDKVSMKTKKTENIVDTQNTLNQDISRKSATKTSTIATFGPLTSSKISTKHECASSDITHPDRSHETNSNYKYSAGLLDNVKSSLHILKKKLTKPSITSEYIHDTKGFNGNDKYLEQFKIGNERSNLLSSKTSKKSNMNLKNYVEVKVSQKTSRSKQSESAAVNEKANRKINALSNSRTRLHKIHKCMTDVLYTGLINKPTLVQYDSTKDVDNEDNYLASIILSSDGSQISGSEKQLKKNVSSKISKKNLNHSYGRNNNSLNKRSTSSRFNESLNAQKPKNVLSSDESRICFAKKFSSTLANVMSANTFNQNNTFDMKNSVSSKSHFMLNESQQNLNDLTTDNAVCALDDNQTAFTTQYLNKTLEQESTLKNFNQIYKLENVASECHIDLNESLESSNTFTPENTSSSTIFSDILNKYFQDESTDSESTNTNGQKYNLSFDVATKELASEPTTDFLTDSSTDQHRGSFNYKLEGTISEQYPDSYIDDGLPNDPQKVVEKLKNYLIEALGKDDASSFFKTTSEQNDSDLTDE